MVRLFFVVIFVSCVCGPYLVAQEPAADADSLRNRLVSAQQEFGRACEAADADLLQAIVAALQDATADADFARARRLADTKTAYETQGLLPTDESVSRSRAKYHERFIEARLAAEDAFDQVVAEHTRNGDLALAEAVTLEKKEWLERVRKRKAPKTKYIPDPELPDIVNSVGMTLVQIPAGTFTMGTVAGTALRESPPHEVTLTKGFYLGACEVTNEQWKKIYGEVRSDRKEPDLPVTRVNWADARAFCDTLSSKAEEKALRLRYRLPTEAEWEYACRAGSTGKFCFGDEEDLLGDYAWFKGNSETGPQPVGKKKPNRWGLFDMHGNLREWCNDWRSDTYYADSPKADPTGPASGTYKMSRGGSWEDESPSCRSATRIFLTTSHRWETLGFRVVGEKY